MTKVCSMCREDLPYEAFNRNRATKTGRHAYCRQCQSDRKKHWDKANREARSQYRRAYRVRGMYNVDLDRYARTWAAQAGLCAVCKQETPLQVDHNHTCCAGPRSCGKCVRGLLCPGCNAGLGMFEDDPARLASAIEYLKVWS